MVSLKAAGDKPFNEKVRGRPHCGAFGLGRTVPNSAQGPAAAPAGTAARPPRTGTGGDAQASGSNPGGLAGFRRGVFGSTGAVFVGDSGLMSTVMRGEAVWLLPTAKWAEYKLPDRVLPRSRDHYRDWIRAWKGGVPPCSAGLLLLNGSHLALSRSAPGKTNSSMTPRRASSPTIRKPTNTSSPFTASDGN